MGTLLCLEMFEFLSPRCRPLPGSMIDLMDQSGMVKANFPKGLIF
jgi:hypothetical protein